MDRLRRFGLALGADLSDDYVMPSTPPPTGDEIRRHLEARWAAPVAGGLSLAGAFSDAFGEAASVTEGLWELDEFRAAELDRYDALRSAAVRVVQRRAEADLLEALADALVEFALVCPKAPRTAR